MVKRFKLSPIYHYNSKFGRKENCFLLLFKISLQVTFHSRNILKTKSSAALSISTEIKIKTMYCVLDITNNMF